MTASLPVIKYCTEQNLTYEELISALVFLHLTAIYFKTSVGRLSAYCGVMSTNSLVTVPIAFIKKVSCV
ncbi:MAG: L-serine ammonia-lyase, iron-sulfur-dependent, subunit alpha [Campylobacteraceae bacterium]|nr:L-serine ammonia-lyase, iron-sulfur-dependent, subunit alpha [Campylobacteraceae bacterium]